VKNVWHYFKKNCTLWGLGKWEISPTELT